MPAMAPSAASVVVLAAAAVFVVLLAENARIPFDDPNTHLELTMIHEVMVLDHGGIDLAMIQYAASLKLWIFSALVAGLILPFRAGGSAGSLLNFALGLAGVAAVAVAVGLVESMMARLRLLRVPQLLLGALVLSVLGLILALR